MGLSPQPASEKAEQTPPDTSELRGRIAASVRDLRGRSGRSLAEVAADAHIGKSTLHAIEAGVANPGIETLWALAGALGVPFGALLEPPAPTTRVVRAAEAPRIASESSAMQALLLTTTSHGARVEVYALELGLPDESSRSGEEADGGGAPQGHAAAPHSPGTVEHVIVTSGRLLIGPTEEPVELGPGDLVSFPGDVGHCYQPLEPSTKAVLLIEYA